MGNLRRSLNGQVHRAGASPLLKQRAPVAPAPVQPLVVRLGLVYSSSSSITLDLSLAILPKSFEVSKMTSGSFL